MVLARAGYVQVADTSRGKKIIPLQYTYMEFELISSAYSFSLHPDIFGPYFVWGVIGIPFLM